MEKTIRIENIKFTAEPFNKIVEIVLEKYGVKGLNKDMVNLERNSLDINVIIELPRERITSPTGLMTVLKNEIVERILFFSSIRANSIQIILGTEE
jgi:hypothetical protein